VQSQALNGILGDPTGAKAEDGATLLALAADILARDIELAAGTPSAAAAP
jgi:creatinine amidohydrolase/Fe(II)-dependent formamide hydrolase-like protein